MGRGDADPLPCRVALDARSYATYTRRRGVCRIVRVRRLPVGNGSRDDISVPVAELPRREPPRALHLRCLALGDGAGHGADGHDRGSDCRGRLYELRGAPDGRQDRGQRSLREQWLAPSIEALHWPAEPRSRCHVRTLVSARPCRAVSMTASPLLYLTSAKSGSPERASRYPPRS